ncbi:hypothetical protein LC724_04805 [Blautia sp. RD014234]|nr:hypothetical protein [Blautia parvula]
MRQPCGQDSIIIFVAVVFVTMFQENRRRQREFLQKIKKGWGQIPDREYTWDKLEQIGEYFRRRKDGRFVIDDITWNDLDMDRVFMLMNQTISSPGRTICTIFSVLLNIRRKSLRRGNGCTHFFGNMKKNARRSRRSWHTSESRLHRLFTRLFM